MADLIAPHGGIADPVNRTEAIFDPLSSDQIPVANADLSILYRIADGGLSPLVGPMIREEYDRVLEEEVIVRNGKKYAWTIPLALPVEESKARHLHLGDRHPLTSEMGQMLGEILVQSVYPWDKKKYNASLYGTTREDHPGPRIANSDPRTWLVGGEVRVLPQPKNPDFGDLILTPRETRELFARKGWQRVVADPACADESALITALERLTREGFFAGAVLNPLIGEMQPRDVDAATRMKTYRELLENKAFGQDTDAALWKKVGRNFRDQVMLLGLDMKPFYAGAKEAVMQAIYRQNFGFTDIIDRKYADSWPELKGELLIRPVKVD